MAFAVSSSFRMAAVFAATLAGTPAMGAVINVQTAATLPFPTSPAVLTVDANSVTNGARGISGTRVNRQGFTVASSLTVGSIFLSASSYGNTAFTITFFNTTDPNAKPIALGTQITQITVPAFGSTATGADTIEVDLNAAEQFTLPAGGYIVAIAPADTTSGSSFSWVMSNTGTDLYSGGRYYRDDGDTTNTRDYGFALTAAGGGTVPEPASVGTLLAFSAAALVRRRKA